MNRICDFYVLIKNVFKSKDGKREYNIGVRERTLEIKRERLFQTQQNFNDRNEKIIKLSHNKQKLLRDISNLYNERDSLISSINKLKNIPSDEPNDDECHICFHIYSFSVSKKSFPCGHDLCTDCATQVDICPFCRYIL